MSAASGAPGQRTLQLALRGDWSAVEQSIRATQKGEPDIAQVDEVNHSVSSVLKLVSIVVSLSLTLKEKPITNCLTYLP